MSNGGGGPVDAGGRGVASRGRPISRWFRRSEASTDVEDRTSLIGYSRATPYLLSGPSIIMVSVLLAFPVLYAMWGSLFDTEFLGGEQDFVGLQNYVDLFKDPDFRSSITHNLVFVTGCLVLGISLALVF